MRKIFILLFVAAVVFMSCSGKQNTSTTAEVGGLSFDSVVVDTAVYLTNDTSSPSYSIKLSIQYAKGENAKSINDYLVQRGILPHVEGDSMGIEQQINHFVEGSLDEYKDFCLPLFRQDPEHSESLNNSFEARTETHNSYDNIVNYIAHIYNYGGGAHGVTMTIAFNLDAKTGKAIELSDLFVPGYENALTGILKDKLMKRLDVKNDEELKEKIFLDSPLYIPDNFILDKDKLTFIYCQNEIAPYSEGEIALEIDKSDISDLLKK